MNSKEELYLPKGKYTVRVEGNFDFAENVHRYPSELLCELEIEVKEIGA